MAHEVILGQTVILQIDTESPITDAAGDPAEYRTVACGVSKGVNMGSADVPTTSDCSEDYEESLTGTLNWSFDFDGQAVPDVDADQANYDELFGLALAKTRFWARIIDPTNEIYREGVVRIPTFTEKGTRDQPYTFTANFKGTGSLLLSGTT